MSDPFAVPPTPTEAEFDSLPVLRLVGEAERVPAGVATERELVSFFVPLRPRTKGSLRPVISKDRRRVVLVEQIAAGPAWRERCATEAQEALGQLTPEGVAPAGFPYAGDVRVEIEFRFPCRPGDDRPRPTSRYYGDLDKLMRNAWDALTDAAVIKDDSLVAESTSSKIFAVDGEPVGAAVTVVAL